MENLSPVGLLEKVNLKMHPITLLASLGHERNALLACQVTVNGDCTIETTPNSTGAVRISGEAVSE